MALQGKVLRFAASKNNGNDRQNAQQNMDHRA